LREGLVGHHVFAIIADCKLMLAAASPLLIGRTP